MKACIKVALFGLHLGLGIYSFYLVTEMNIEIVH